MSDNPFASPDPNTQGSKPIAVKKAPGGLTAILIICLVLGILGLLGSCFAGAMLAIQPQLNQMQQAGGPQQAVQKNMEEIQKQQLIPNIIINGLNFVVAPLLILGSIGGLNRKSWAAKVLNIGLILAVFFTVFKTVMTVIMQLAAMEPMQEMMQQQMENNAQNVAEFASGIMQVSIYIGIGFAVIWAIVLLGFYIWAWTYLRKDNVRQYLGVA